MIEKKNIIIKWSNLGPTNPASINRLTGVLTLNYNVYPFLSKESKEFIINHELGHYLKNTTCEFEADEFALNKIYGNKKQSLKKAIKGLAEGLSGNQLQHYKRIDNLIIKAHQIDNKMNYEKNKPYNYESEHFLGLGSKAKKAHKQALKDEYGSNWRQVWKQEKKDAGGGSVLRQQFREQDKINKTNQAMQQFGIDNSESMTKLDNLIDQYSSRTNSNLSSSSSNTYLYIGIAVIVGAVLFFYFKNKK